MLALFCISGVWNAASGTDLEPVWSIEIRGDEPVILKNQFADSESRFPVDAMLVRGDKSSSLSRLITGAPNEAPLYINPDGTIRNPLVWLPWGTAYGQLGRGSLALLVTARSAPDINRLSTVEKGLIRIQGVDEAEPSYWEKSSDDRFGAIHVKGGTILINPSTSLELARYPHRTFDFVFSEIGNRSAAVAYYGGNTRFGVAQYNDARIVVFDFDGRVEFETDFAPVDYRKLYMDPSGSTLLFDRVTKQGTETICMSLSDRSERQLTQLPGRSFRYYSGDKRYMLVVQTGAGRAFHYDIRDPCSPVEIGRVQLEDQSISTAAVCDDGSLVALHVFSVRGSQTRRVIVLDSQLTKVASAHSRVTIDFRGLEFAGKYLFVGVQTHPVGMDGSRGFSTRRVNLFDLRDVGKQRE